MAGLTFLEAEHALEVIDATWAREEIEFLAELPEREIEPFIALAHYFGARPVPESML